MTSLSVLIPTAGRESIHRCLESCVDAGLQQGDLVIVIADTHEWDRMEALESLMKALRPVSDVCDTVALVHDAGHHCFGHCQLNAGLDYLQTLPDHRIDYVTCQDDDDIYTAGAFTRMRAAADALAIPQPMLFRFQSWFGPVFWDQERVVAENHIGGHCAVFPNDERLGRFTCRYQGDFDYIRSTLDAWGGDDKAVWVDDVIAVARPQIVKREQVTA